MVSLPEQIKFITFGSHHNYIGAANRLYKQARQLNMFTDTRLYTADHLKNDLNFWNNIVIL